MTLRTSLIALGLLGALGLLSQTPMQAAEVTILVNQGALSGVRDLAAGFEKASGHKVVIDFVGIPQQNEKIATDAPGDVLVNFLPTFEDLAKNSKVVAGTVVEFARAGNGVAVKAGAPKPTSHAGGVQAGDAQCKIDRPQQYRLRAVQYAHVPTRHRPDQD
jgi:molybdate transport system substrate-binding protein